MLRLFKQFYPIRNIFFIFGEAVLIFISVIIASYITLGNDVIFHQTTLYLKAFLITLICQTCLYHNEMYDVKIVDNRQELFWRLVQSLGSTTIILSGVQAVFHDEIVNNTAVFISLILISIIAITWRFFYQIILDHGVFNKNIAVVGHGDLINTILFEMSLKRDSGYNLIYLCLKGDQGNSELDMDIEVKFLKNNYSDLFQLIQLHRITMLVTDTGNDAQSNHLKHELLKCRIGGITIVDGNSFYEMAAGKLNVNRIKTSWLIYSDGFKTSMHHRFVKRIIDYTLSLTLLVLVLPIILFTAILIKIDSPGPVLFSQERMGKSKKKYRMYKFRSMSTNAEDHSGPTWAKQNDTRITRVGKYIRNWRIDELPQLFNVIKGDMSFVGPRPEREYFINQLEKVIPYYGIRSSVKPGITGWAQVNYGYGASVDDAVEKLNYDLYYIKNASVSMDIFIVFRTTKTVMLGVDMGK